MLSLVGQLFFLILLYEINLKGCIKMGRGAKPYWEWITKTVKRRLIFKNEKYRIYKQGTVRMHVKIMNGNIVKSGKEIPITNFGLFNKKGEILAISNDLKYLKTRMDNN